jgi:hypothetical protein
VVRSPSGFERRFNPALQHRSRADFVEFVLEGLPPRPEAFAENRRRNLHDSKTAITSSSSTSV